MSDQHNLSSATVQKIRATLANFPEIEKAVLFGSRAKGSSKPGSDIDLALFGRDLNTALLDQIDNALDDLFLPYRIDLIIHDRIAHRDLLDHIARVGILFYEPLPAVATPLN